MMTPEEHWFTAGSGSEMLEAHENWFEYQERSRKTSLLVIAHARRVWPTIVEADRLSSLCDDSLGSHRPSIDSCAVAIDVCEQFLDGQATPLERQAAVAEMEELDRMNHGPFLSLALGQASDFALGSFNGETLPCYTSPLDQVADVEQNLANLIRDIFGNPFRPVTFSLEWRTDAAVPIASQMYDSRDFSAMPILADALQDAGCDNDDILSHCRAEGGAHVRGCWVVGLVLGKE